MLALSLCMVWVAISDAKSYIISNRLNAVLLALFVAGVVLLPIHEWWLNLAAAAPILFVGLGIFALGLMGGGDVKLLVVLALWTGWDITTAQFIFLTAIAGGLLVVVVLLARWLIAPLWKGKNNRPLPRLLTRKQPVPYGIAIAMAFGWMLWTGMIPPLATPALTPATSTQEAAPAKAGTPAAPAKAE